MGRVRNRPCRDDPRHGDRAGDGDVARRVRHPGDDRDHDHGVSPVPVPGRDVRDDAGADGRLPILCLRGVQGPVAEIRAACERVHRLGLLAGLVPGCAAEHDPGLVLHHREVQPVPGRVYAHPHADRLLDDHHLGGGDPAHLHPRVARHPPGRDVRHGARVALDDPPDAARADAVPAPVIGRLGPALGLQAPRRHRLLHECVRSQLAGHLHRLLVPPDMERDRDGGGGLLHRRVPRPGARRQDRDEPGGPVRPLHLHLHPDRLRGRARRDQALERRRSPTRRRSSRHSRRRCSAPGPPGSTG